jgi:cytosine/adenosine deaminase-related metal-dependent hydrolase
VYENVYRGLLIESDGIRHGYIVPHECKFEETRLEYADYIFSQTFFNAHTHLGDVVAREPEFKDLESIVGPSGYKHRILKQTPVEVLRKQIEIEVDNARRNGTSHFLDFREGGIEGLRAVENIAGILPLGRPATMEEAALMKVEGFGMSSTRDHSFEFLEELRSYAKRKKLLFAIHAGERDCEDVEKALELDPDLLIHMNNCQMMLEEVMNREIPIVSCLRSNSFFGLLNQKCYRELKKYDLWMLGTDNAMVSSPCMLDEMHFAAYILRDDGSIFNAAIRGYNIFEKKFNAKPGYIIFNRRGNFRKTTNFLATLVRRARESDIEGVILPVQ